MLPARLLLLCLGVALARRFHDEQYHKHAHTYLQFCANATFVSSHACVHKVSAKWPQPAQLDPQECKESAAPYASVGTTNPWCTAGSEELVNIYDPITIPQASPCNANEPVTQTACNAWLTQPCGTRKSPTVAFPPHLPPCCPVQGLVHPNVDYRKGADTDTLTDWDRVRCRDGQLFATGCVHLFSCPTPRPVPGERGADSDSFSHVCSWYRKYTPQECARLCSKISNFYGKSCTHFSRQWIKSNLPEHSDTCGRDGESIASDMPAHGAWGSAGVGEGSYSFRGQCLFFNSHNNECCSTKAAWREAGSLTDDNYCTAKFGDRKDNWDTKHRSWRLKTQAFSPTSAWPVTSLGRRLGTARPVEAVTGEEPLIHELFLFSPNGTLDTTKSFWAIEEEYDGEATDKTHCLASGCVREGPDEGIAEQSASDLLELVKRWLRKTASDAHKYMQALVSGADARI
jgi:hypothetical protein